MRHPPPAICQNLGVGGGQFLGGGSAGGCGGGFGRGGGVSQGGGGLCATHYYHMHTSRGDVCLGVWWYGGMYVIPGGGGGDILCGGKYESTNSGATKSVPLLKNERTNYVWFPIIAHEKQWALVVFTCTNP